VLRIPGLVADVGACLRVASELVTETGAEAAESTARVDEAEASSLKQAFGEGGTATGAGRGGAAARGATRAASAALKDLEGRQKSRATRTQRDALDRALTDLAGFYRDVLVVQLGAGIALTNTDVVAEITAAAREATSESTLRRLEAILQCRTMLDANVNALLAVEAMTLSLRAG
jgi:DNA polymerase-3 subunit delta'